LTQRERGREKGKREGIRTESFCGGGFSSHLPKVKEREPWLEAKHAYGESKNTWADNQKKGNNKERGTM